MNHIIAALRNQVQKIKCRLANLTNRIVYLETNCCNGGGDGVQSIQDGNGTDIDNTDPNNPIINILEVSATESGIVNNTPLQELGGADKLINGVRIGRGSGNNEDNLIVGKDTLSTNTTGTYNTAFGGWALTENTTGSFNSSFGSGALYSNTTGIYNNAFGTSTLQNNTTGSRNVGVGTSLFWNSTGQENTGVGSNAGYGATTGSQNTYIGNQAGYNNGIGSYNTAIGSRAMITSGTGIPASTLDMNRNVFIGAGLTLADGVNDVLAIDNKGATNTFYSNALLYGNFADRFLRINGRFEIDDATMPTADATYTKKLVWNPTTGVVAETDDLGGSTPTLSEVLAEGNEGDDGQIIKLVNSNKGGTISELSSQSLGFTDSNYSNSVFISNNGLSYSSNWNLSTERSISFDLDDGGIKIFDDDSGKGLQGAIYYGANYDDNTYVQKKYVDDAIDAIPTPSLTLEQARQNGNVLEGNVVINNPQTGFISPDGYSFIGLDEDSQTGMLFSEDGFTVYGSKIKLNNGSIAFYTKDAGLDFVVNINKIGIVGDEEFDKQGDRKAFAQIADVEDFYTTITGYDAGETQTLKHINGVLQWVTD